MKALLLSTIFLFAGQALALGLQTSVAADIVGEAGLQRNSGAADGIKVRGAEVLFYAPADHLFDGQVSFAAHGEGGIAKVELHEAFVGSTKLIPRSRFRLGQFFLGLGRLNQFHQHDWPFISAPRVHKEFFASEGALDTGGEYSYLFPFPFYLEATVGVTNGFIYGHDHAAGARPMVPTHYGRLTTYSAAPLGGGVQVGLNYLGRKDNAGTQRSMVGLDVTAKWKEAKTTQFLLQSEFWYRSMTPHAKRSENAFGFYLYPEYYVGHDVFVGTRFDYYTVLNLQGPTGATVKNYELNFVPTITWKPSEFALFRLAYNHKPEYLVDKVVNSTNYLEAQAVFILGAHPAHDF